MANNLWPHTKDKDGSLIPMGVGYGPAGGGSGGIVGKIVYAPTNKDKTK